MKSNKIRPVLRYPGSKYKMVDEIIKILDIKKEDEFWDLFGGSGIVGVNVKALTEAKVLINDFDKILSPLTFENAMNNQCSYMGLGKNYSKLAVKQFKTKLANGYKNKFNEYKKILDQCEIENEDALDYWGLVHGGGPRKIYVDPPYHKIKGLYKSDFTEEQHFELFRLLTHISLDSKILISYNDTPFIRELYSRSDKWYINERKFSYRTGRGKTKQKTNELLITNFKIKEKHNER